jgi:hypothetical protein
VPIRLARRWAVEVLRGIGGSCFLLTSAALAVRLFQLAYRNRAVPELLLGAAFLCGGTLGATMEASSQTLVHRVGRPTR